LKRNHRGYTLIWRMPRRNLIEAARLQSENKPRDYGTWFDLVCALRRCHS
jgi:hypothetical protein